ncbi:MAG: hypothetical protein ACI4UT_03895, partial [Candidatus Enteromonas sp.]
MKSKANFLALLASIALLASCGEGTPNESSSIQGEDPASSSSSSTVDAPVTYKIVIRASEGVEVQSDKSEAEKGETVTLTVTLAEGFSLKSIALNGDSSKIAKVSDTTYTFVMPDTSAVITTTVDVEGDCVVTGDVAARLEPQADGSFKGTVSCERDSLVDIKLGSVSYTFVHVDHDHSFGYYESAYGSSNAFRLAGNAIYEITVTPSAEKPVKIIRVGVFHAPTNVKELESLFNGDFAGRGVLDGGAFAVPGLSGVSYKNNVSGIQYDWSLYEKGSFAMAKSLLDEDDVSYDVKVLDGNTYKVVDSYIETIKDSEGRYFDDSVRTDTVAYSGTYAVESVIDEESDALQRYKRSAARAASEIAMPSHNLYSLSREICYGYRVGFTVEDDLAAARVAITPTDKGAEGFEVEVYSWKNYDPNASTYADATKVERKEYRISLAFNADSTLASGSYVENYYDETNWNFNNSDSENGGSIKTNAKPVIKRKSSFTYS